MVLQPAPHDRSGYHFFVLHASRCSNNCVFCSSRTFGDLARNIEDEFSKLDEILGEQPIATLEISGSDPGEYPALPDLVRECYHRTGAGKITLATHGRTLCDTKVVNNLTSAGVQEYLIPLYGHTAAVHDAVTQSPGSFEQTTAGLRNLSAAGLGVRLSTLITRENQAFLKELLSCVAGITTDCTVAIPYYHSPHARYRQSIADFDALRGQLSEALRHVAAEGFMPVLISIPYCLLDFWYPKVVMSRVSKYDYRHWRRPDLVESGAAQVEGKITLPRYRVLTKGEECKSCSCEDICAGFYETYVDAGYFKFRPLESRPDTTQPT